MLVVVGFLCVAALSNHSKDMKVPEGLFVVADDTSYLQGLQKANELSGKAMQDYQEGKQLTSEELVQIQTAVQWIDEANLYKPDKVGPFFLSGKAYAALGDYQKADEKLRQGLANVGNDKSEAMQMAAVDAHYELSRIHFAMGDYARAYDEATIAATAVPNAPDYLVARAKAALQVNKPDVAREELTAALAIDPNNAGAKLLSKFLESSQSPKHK